MKYGLIGEHLGHSYSVEIHKSFGNYKYKLCEVKRDQIDAFLTKKDFSGINVTIPYKQTVIPYLDYVSDEVKEIGACNTIINKDGKLYGYNTDVFGLEALINHAKIEIENKVIAILGNGGASKAAKYVATKMHAKKILIVSRRNEPDTIGYNDIPNDIDVIINCTPVGMFPKCDESPVELDKFNNLSGVIDVIYNPLQTDLIFNAHQKSIKAEGGLYMLVAQGFYASELFQDKKLDLSLIEKSHSNIVKDKRNIILTGMPTSGKSGLGKRLAKVIDKKFVDTDFVIEEKVGMSIPTYFKEFGEEKFRELESSVLHDLGNQTGLIIATGGGAILKDENIKYMKRNGRVYFLDRPFEMLFASSKRPLTSSKDDLKKRYDERIDRYRSTADTTVDGSKEFDYKIDFIKKEEEK